MIIGGMYTIDFTRVSKIPKFEINIKNGDSKRIIRLILLETGVAINLNNYTVTVAAKKSDGTNIFNHVEIIDALAGICEVEITEQMLALDMDLPCEIVLYSHDGVVASSSNFVLSIISSVRNEESIVSSNEFSALTKALSDVTYLKSNLNKKMNKDDSILVSQINKNAGKLDETYMSDEFLKQITGKSPLSSVVADESITFKKLANYSIAHPKMLNIPAYLLDFIECKNLINRNDDSYEHGRFLRDHNSVTGQPFYTENDDYVVSNFIPVRANQIITVSSLEPVGIFYFDITKSKVLDKTSGSKGKVGKNIQVKVPANNNIAYLKLSFSNCKTINGIKYDNDEMVVYGNKMPVIYQEYGINFKNFKLSLDNINSDDLQSYFKDYIYSINKINRNFVESINIFDKTNSEIEIGKFLETNAGNVSITSTSAISHYIPVLPNERYSFKFYPQIFGANKGYVFYDNSKKVIVEPLNYNYDDVNEIITLTVPNNPNIKYIRVNFAKGDIDNFMVVKGSRYPTEYIQNNISLTNNIDLNNRQKNTVSKLISKHFGNSNKSILDGKIITFNGDSICRGAENSGGYGKIIAEKYNMIYENISVGGGTITSETYLDSKVARHWISRTISKMRPDADYIILEGGVNDASLNVPLGIITPDYTSKLDDTTYCGAFESMLKQTLEKYPEKKIGYIIVHKMTKNYDSRYSGNFYYKSKEICEKWGVPYLDLNIECPPLNYIPSLKKVYTHNGDGWHLTELGYKKYYVDKIVSWLESL